VEGLVEVAAAGFLLVVVTVADIEVVGVATARIRIPPLRKFRWVGDVPESDGLESVQWICMAGTAASWAENGISLLICLGFSDF
jgi:hypothetical protein